MPEIVVPRASRCPSPLSLVMLLAALLPSLVGCASHAPPDRLQLRFIVSPDRDFRESDLRGPLEGHAIHFDPRTLECRGAGVLAHYNSQAKVVVRDQRGQVLGSGELGPGRVIRRDLAADGVPIFKGCGFGVSIPLKGTARIYIVDVADGAYRERMHVSQFADRKGVLNLDVD